MCNVPYPTSRQLISNTPRIKTIQRDRQETEPEDRERASGIGKFPKKGSCPVHPNAQKIETKPSLYRPRTTIKRRGAKERRSVSFPLRFIFLCCCFLLISLRAHIEEYNTPTHSDAVLFLGVVYRCGGRVFHFGGLGKRDRLARRRD